MRIQSILIPKKKFSRNQADNWIVNNGHKLTFHGKEVHETEKYYRYRQRRPMKDSGFGIKVLPNGIRFIMMD